MMNKKEEKEGNSKSKVLYTMAHMGRWYGEVDKRRKQLMVENQSIVDSSTSKPSTKKPSTRKLSTSNHPAFALLLLAGTLLLIALACLPSPALAATPITTCAELQEITYNLDGDYYLANDINCSGFYCGDREGFMPIGTDSNRFIGTFDGKGYKITHLYINPPPTLHIFGLFGCTGSGSEIKNVGLEEVNVKKGSGYVSGLVGDNDGTIDNCNSSGSVSSPSFSYDVGWVGGLVGKNDGTITNSYSSCSVTGSITVGGLVGENDGTITNSYSSCSVSGYMTVGGLVGKNDGTITNSYSSCSVTGYTDFIGGLVGKNDGKITNSYSSGSVSGDDSVGGLVGKNDGKITNSYSSGSVSDVSGFGTDFGGLVGTNDGTIKNSYWDTNTSGQSKSAGGTGKTTAQMKQQATFSGWDFKTIWGIVEHVTYPYLQWQHAAVEPPSITSFAPHPPVSDPVRTWRTFSVTVDQTVNVSWYLNGSLLFTNQSVTEANYTLHAEFVSDNNNVSAIAENANGSDMQTWVWNVTTAGLTCGDICVNTTGWWRADAAFNASNTPIQHAINNATEGNTICVKDGTYNENVDVTKRLTIRSENGSVVTIVKAALVIDQIFNVTADYVNISGFTVKDAPGAHGAGIDVKADNCNISYNNATNNYYGIRISSSSKFNTLMKNTVSNNLNNGIHVVGSNNTLANNFVNSNNPNGIYLQSSSHNTLTGNTVSSNDIGIRMMDSSNYNMLTGNHIVNSSPWGIYVDSSSDNHIYNNYFDNTGGTAGNAYAYGGSNIWNTTKTAGTNIVGGPYLGGNYWSDYTGKDSNGDGLGDTPYTNIIPPGLSNKDYLPLVVIPANFTVNLSAHWNGLSLPLNDRSVTNASSLAAKIGVNCKEVLGWNSTTQKYVPYIPGKPFHNFDIKAGEGCMVNLKKPTPVVFTGKGWTSPFTVQLAQNYTALSAPVKDSSITKASSLATKIGGCKLIAKYDGAKQKTVCYRPHGGDIPPPGDVCSSTEDFEITGGDAYFVYVPNPTKVTFVGVPWHN